MKMCEVLGVSTSGYYDWKKRPISPQKKRKLELTREVKRVFKESKERYGSPKITEQLKQDGIVTSRRTVQRIMEEEEIQSCTVKRFKVTTNSTHSYPIYDNLLKQNFTTQAPGQAWVSDITYIWTNQGWVYLASVMDLFSRKIIGFHISHRLNKDLVIIALQRAMNAQKPREGLIHHSDRGSQYASNEYIELLKKAHIKVSMSRKGNCYDNACIESFHSAIKKELVYQNQYRTREEAKQSIFEYIICFYNSKRLHSTLQFLSPNVFEKRYFEQWKIS